MIIGTFNNPEHYIGFGERVVRAIQYMLEHDPKTFPLGKNSIDGDNIYFTVSENETVKADEKLFEAHKKYIDIQMTLSGEEWYGYSHIDKLREEIPYNPEKDAAFYSGEGEYFKIPEGQFALFMPEDAHNPCVYFNQQGRIRKIVIKVKI